MKFDRDNQDTIDRQWQIRDAEGAIRGPFALKHISELLEFDNICLPFEIRSLRETDWIRSENHPGLVATIQQKPKLALTAVVISAPKESKSINVEEILQINLRKEAEVADKDSSRINRERIGYPLTCLLVLGLFSLSAVAAVYMLSRANPILGIPLGVIACVYYIRSNLFLIEDFYGRRS